jgi:hypothetical protein
MSMRSSLPFRSRARRPLTPNLLAFLAMLVGGDIAQAQQTRVISGVVIDRETSAPVPQALLRIQNTELQAVTSTEGTFRITVPVGRHVLLVEHIAYGNHTDTVQVRADQDVRIQIQISRQAIQLTPLTVQGESQLETRRRTTGSSFNELRREYIDGAQQKGFNLAEALRDGMMSVQVSGERRGGSYCVEYRSGTFQNKGGAVCREVAVYIDDVKISNPSTLYSTMPLRDIERIEMLGPNEAGTRYGISGGRGVLLIETRQGILAQRRPERKGAPMAGLDWSLETQPYRWAKVAGSSIVGSAVGLGLAMLVADQCLRIEPGTHPLRSKCDAFSTVASGFIVIGLPSVAGSFAASRAGATERSKGRILPSALLGTLSAAGGYLLYVQGKSNDSQFSTTTGILLVTVGTPVLTTVGDRLFRSLR